MTTPTAFNNIITKFHPALFLLIQLDRMDFWWFLPENKYFNHVMQRTIVEEVIEVIIVIRVIMENCPIKYFQKLFFDKYSENSIIW